MYAKLFTSIYQGTLRGHSHGLLVFTNLMAHADAAGEVDIHPKAIADEVGLPVEAVRDALIFLESPDAESRTPDEEGRRLVRLGGHRDWGWKIVNYAKYRAIRNEDDRREQNRQAQARWRAKQADSKQDKQSKPPSAQAEAEAEATEKIAASPLPPRPSRAASAPAFDGENSESINPRSIVLLAPNWELPEDWGNDAVALGWIPKEVLFEAEKFRQYWTSGKGAGTRRSVKGWRQTWSNWLGKAGNRK